MALDTTAFRNAIAQLVCDGVIQRFEYTYELSHKFLRRFLEETEPAPDSLKELSFPALIRLGSERGLLREGWDVWSGYRAARGATGHTYDSVKAAAVFARIPAFLGDARFLLDAIERRLAPP